MHMLYNSENYVVVQFDAAPSGADEQNPSPSSRGGYEIVDKFARKEIFIDGELALRFKAGVDALIETGPTEDEMDEYLARYTSLMQQPVVLH